MAKALLISNIWVGVFLIVLLIDFFTVVTGCVAHIVMVSLFSQITPFSAIFLTCLVGITFFTLVYFAIDSIGNRNSFELFGFVVISLLLRIRMLWSVSNLFVDLLQTDDKDYRVVIIVCALIPGVIEVICQVLYFILFFPLRKSYQWKIVEEIGSSVTILYLNRLYKGFHVVLKINLLLICTVIPMLFFYVDYQWIISYVSMGFFILLSIGFYLLLILYAVKKENYFIFIVFFIFTLIPASYYFYKLVAMWCNVPLTIREPEEIGSTFSEYQIATLLTVMMTIHICWSVFLLVMLVLMMVNFGKGMKTLFESTAKEEKRISKAFNNTVQES